MFGVSVSPRSEAANRWDLHQREGGMLTLGVGGSPIGRGGDLVIVDDPYKNYADAMNPRVRKKVLEWWTGTMVSRVEPGGSVIIIMARWHHDDLIGVLSRAQPDEWEVLTMPALCTDPDTDPLGRKMGEALWEARYPVHVLEKRHAEVSITEGEVVWESQFQQNPKASNGGFFKDEAWGYYKELPQDEAVLPGLGPRRLEEQGRLDRGAPHGRRRQREVVHHRRRAPPHRLGRCPAPSSSARPTRTSSGSARC
jgi:hypothetical protein